eukprot:GHVL01014761.1.p1 GENE.GHVL01014761.1~~GHVL01014761.1.p1  ORF type:complete len:165 (-),score=31.61 GHVL01014761.1:65-559(-)
MNSLKNQFLPSLCRRFCSKASNFHVVKDMPAYEKFVYETPDQLIVSMFTAKFSNQSILIKDEYKKLAESFPQHVFTTIDCDEVPRAAYHADVDCVPSIVIMKRDDHYRQKVTPTDYAQADDLIQRTKTYIDNFKDSMMIAGPAEFTQNIGYDNLNIKRVGWIYE